MQDVIFKGRTSKLNIINISILYYIEQDILSYYEILYAFITYTIYYFVNSSGYSTE